MTKTFLVPASDSYSEWMLKCDRHQDTHVCLGSVKMDTVARFAVSNVHLGIDQYVLSTFGSKSYTKL